VSIADARKALDGADELAREGGDLDAIRHQAQVASLNAQIASYKILTHDAREEIDEASAQRQTILLQVRERQARAAADRADVAQQRAEEAQKRAEEMKQRTARLREQLSELRAEQTNRGIVVRLDDILFATDAATLKPGADRTLDKIAEVLRRDGDLELLIEGHTDSRGTAEYNQALSAQRAAAVQSALLGRGVPATQMRAIGRGESTPIASNENAGGRQENRRVELIFPQHSWLASDQ
jgi:outer membrane protein OmpA-like peptidoglycan-associated protein